MSLIETEGKKVSQYINELPEKEIEHFMSHMDKKNFQRELQKIL